MKAAVIKQHGSTHSSRIVFEERKISKLKPTQVLVKIKCCGLNHLDTWVRRGVPGHKFPLPLIPGSDITGVVEEIGSEVSHLSIGARVIINPGLSCGHCLACDAGKDNLCNEWGLLGETIDGGCQEYIAVESRQVHHLPESISFEHGACIPVAYMTAWEMLVEKAKVEPGQTLLVHGAGSGVSVACIQIAKLFGMQIFVTSRSEDKLQRAKQLGAHRFINTSNQPQGDLFRTSVKNLTGKVGIDVVVDHVGKETFMESIKVLKKGGKLVSCGATTGADLQIDWKYVFFKNISLIGSTYGNKGQFWKLLKLFEKGKLVSIVDTVLKLDQIEQAHDLIEESKVFGKIILSVA